MHLIAPSRLTGLRSRIVATTKIDFRSLALFRIAIAAIVLWDLAVRATNLEAHYSDAGITPRALALLENPEMSRLSIHFLSGSTTWTAILMGVASISAVALLLGYRTRIATIATWYLLMSLQSRNEGLNYGADHLLRLLLLWAAFLPLDRRFSVMNRKSVNDDTAVSSVASAGILGQVVVVYFFSAVLKILSGPHWFPDGDAVAIAFGNPILTRPAVQWLLPYPNLLQALTYFTLLIELFAPLLLLPLFKTPALRRLGLVSFAALHLGILCFQSLGMFPLVSLSALLLFVPGVIWDRFSPEKATRVHFSHGRNFSNILAGALGILTLAANFDSLSSRLEAGFALPPAARSALLSLRLEQRWSMFARPAPTFNWYTLHGSDAQDRSVDPWNGTREARNLEGIDPQGIFRNPRWTTYLQYPTQPFTGIYAGEKEPFAEYLCRKWNRENPDPSKQLKRIEAHYHSSTRGRAPADAHHQVLWEFPCSG